MSQFPRKQQQIENKTFRVLFIFKNGNSSLPQKLRSATPPNVCNYCNEFRSTYVGNFFHLNSVPKTLHRWKQEERSLSSTSFHVFPERFTHVIGFKDI